MTDTVTLYRADDGWRWRYQASNGRTLADGSQGYSRRIDAVFAACHVLGLDGSKTEWVIDRLRARSVRVVISRAVDGVEFTVQARATR